MLDHGQTPAADQLPATLSATVTERPRHAYDPNTFAEILERLADGEDLTSICRSDPERLPCYDSVRQWAEGNPNLGRAIARARAQGFDEIARRVRLIARGEKDAGATGDTQRDRLICEMDLKLLAKWDPKRYGDLLKLGQPDGSAMPGPVVNQFVIQPVTVLREIVASDAAALRGLAGG